MLDQTQIHKLFLLFSDLPDRDGERWAGLCREAARRVEARLKPEADLANPDHRETLHCAAAAWAYCDYRMLRGESGGREEVRVGDLTVKPVSGTRPPKDATEIRDYFLAQATHLIHPAERCPRLIPVGGAS